MTSGLFYLVFALGLSCSHCHVHWKIQEIKSYHEFFPSRALEEELRTITSAEGAVESFEKELTKSLSKVVDYQHRELQRALRHTYGTDDEACVQGLSSYMTKAIDEVKSMYGECTYTVDQDLKRANRQLTSNWAKYNITYKRTLDDVNHCVIIYPDNLESRDLVEKCIANHEERYFRRAREIQRAYNIDASPAMSEVKVAVLTCLGDAFDAIIKKGTDFLTKLKCCVNSTAYLHWQPVNNTLEQQIYLANHMTKLQVSRVEKDVQMLYDTYLLRAEKYLYYPQEKGFHQELMYSLLRQYFQTVNLTGIHNAGDLKCVSATRAALNNIVERGGSQLSELDTNMREKTTLLLEKIAGRIETLNHLMPSIGNVEVLNCFSQGYIFAPDTVLDCFKLSHSEFTVSYRTFILHTREDVESLENNLEYFENGMKYPSVMLVVEKSFVDADRVLFELQRCLYESSATVYPVTTPAAPATTPTTFLPTEAYYTTDYYYITHDGV